MKIKNYLNKNSIAFLLLLSVNTINVANDHLFTFTNNKDEHGTLSLEFFNKITTVFHNENFIETGTYSGNTSMRAASFFKKIYTSELHKSIYNAAKNRLACKSNIEIYLGESGDILREILPTIKSNMIFWLDAHYCGENTGWGKNVTAVTDEVDAIKVSDIENYVILIDDIRGFGTTIDNKEFICCLGYPSIQNLCKQLSSINPHFDYKLLGDTLMVYDQSKYTLQFSKIVEACTISRILINYTDDEIMTAEQVIAHAQGQEKEFIKWYYRDQNHYNTDEFHPYLWYGLIMLNEQNYESAYNEFTKTISHGYHHWRIYWYAAQAALGQNLISQAKDMLNKAHEANQTYQPIIELLHQLS